jgi:hypothetical protein
MFSVATAFVPFRRRETVERALLGLFLLTKVAPPVWRAQSGVKTEVSKLTKTGIP